MGARDHCRHASCTAFRHQRPHGPLRRRHPYAVWGLLGILVWMSVSVSMDWGTHAVAQERLGVEPPQRPGPVEPTFPPAPAPAPPPPPLSRPTFPPVPPPSPEERDRLPVFGGRTEFPARQSAFGQCVETIVRTCEDANFSDRAIGMDDRVERNCALHIRPHQFDRIAGVGFLDRVWRAQFSGLLARLEFGKTDHPAAG